MGGRVGIGRVALAVVAMAVAAVFVMPAASASEEMAFSVTATSTGPPTIQVIAVEDGVVVESSSRAFTYTGTIGGRAFSGTGVVAVIREVSTTTGAFTDDGSLTFTGSFDGVPSSLFASREGSGVLGVSLAGEWEIISASGGLAGLGGGGTFQGAQGAVSVVAFSGQVEFDQ
jgi:hypothetical protein